MYKSGIISDIGTLFGLEAKDLTVEQLNKIKFNKLVEFIDKDDRIEQILCEKMPNATLDDMVRISEYSDELSKKSKLLHQYNEYIRSKRIPSYNDRNFEYMRSRILCWRIMDDDNRDYEFKMWMKGQSSIIHDRNIDFSWLYSRDQNFSDEIVNNILARNNYVSDALINLIKTLPKEQYLKWIPEIFKKSKYIYIHSLSNDNTPDEYVFIALKAMAKLNKAPELKVKITNDVINKLPPVTRLEVLEKIVNFLPYKMPNNILVDVKSPDDLKQLVFSSTIRHYNRVEALVKQYTQKINWSKNE